MLIGKTFYASNRREWRRWLSRNFQKEKEVWLVLPKKTSGRKSIFYNDSVEEVLCFGWIDSTVKKLDGDNRAQRFSPRREKTGYSQANIERLKILHRKGRVHPFIRASVRKAIQKKFVFPGDILDAIKKNKKAWQNYLGFSAPYRRIRVAYIDGARERPEEFKRRLDSFIRKTEANKLIGYGGIDKYY